MPTESPQAGRARCHPWTAALQAPLSLGFSGRQRCHALLRGSSPPKDQAQVSHTSCIDRWVLHHQCHLGSPGVKPQWWWFSCSVVSNSRNPLDGSPPGPSVHGILQARILEWVAMPYSRGSSQLRDRTRVFCIAGRFFTDLATREAQNKINLYIQYGLPGEGNGNLLQHSCLENPMVGGA